MFRTFFVFSVTVKLVLLRSSYDIRVDMVEIPYYNEEFIGDPIFVFFPFNGTTAFNVSTYVKQDLGMNEYGNVTIYKMTRGQYRLIPTNFHDSPCHILKTNMLGIRDITGPLNITKCPIRKGYYGIHNFVADLDKFPPHLLPSGKYRACGNWYVSSTHIGTACGEGEVKTARN